MSILSLVAYIILAPLIGGLISGVDRKISARMQGRYGPPILQPFYDVIKLFGKDVTVVNKAQNLYVVFFFIFVIFTGAIFFGGGDILMVIFAFTMANIFLVVAAYSTNSPYSTVGAERELIQMMSYEPMMLFTAVGFYLCTGSFNVSDIVVTPLPAIVYLPAIFVGYVYILTIKLRKSPFDLSTSHHAHQELVKGITTEFTGKTLALVEIAHWYENILFIGYVFIFFSWNSPISILVSTIAVIVIYFFEILIGNVFARFKWQVVMKTSWIIAATLGFVNILILSLMR